MIVKLNQLPLYQKKTVLVDGCFDPLHLGHIEYFKFAASFGLPVLCNVENDCYIKKYKRRPSLLPAYQRLLIVDSVKYISLTHLQTTSTADVLKRLRPVKYIKGADWKKKRLPQEEIDICKKYDIQIEYMNKNFDSSSKLLIGFIRKYSRFKE
jgi:D-beta-D-heptose 7-phosphate kinase/D-beta-D-heptose 1-phosphate adenosyltransferase